MIIGLCGLKGSGKDTVGAYLVKEHGFERRSFADPLKRSFAAMFDIPVWEIEKLKNDPTAFVSIGYKNEPNVDPTTFDVPNHMWSPISETSVRNGLQRYGTESHRDVFGQDFWIDFTLPLDGYYATRAIVVTDVRFPNEAQRVNAITGGVVVRIDRPDLDIEDHHSSETEVAAIDPDYVIDNGSTVLDLYERVERMLDEMSPTQLSLAN